MNITVKLDNKEATFSYNTSMRVKDFMTANKIDTEDNALTLMAICRRASDVQTFSAIDISQVAKVNSKIVKKKGSFEVKTDITAYRKVGNNDDHLFTEYVSEQNKKHAKTMEQVAIFRAGLNKTDKSEAQKAFDKGQSNVIKEINNITGANLVA